MTMWQFYKELWKLLRGIPDNPLIWSSIPWRRGWLRGLFFWAQVLLTPITIGGGIYYVNDNPGKTIFGSPAAFWFIMMWIVLIFFGSILSFPLNILAFTNPMTRDRDSLTELSLSATTPRCIAMGDIFWGVVAGCLVPFAGFVQGIAFLPLLEWGGDDLVSTLIFLWFSAICVAVYILVCVFWRFRLRDHLWPIVFIAPPTVVLIGYWCAGLCIPIVEWAEYHDPLPLWCSAVFVTTLLFALIPIAGKLAPTRLLSAIYVESLVERSYFASWWSLWKDKEARQQARAQVRRTIPSPIVPQLASGLLIVGFLPFIVYSIERSPYEDTLPFWLLGLSGIHFVFSSLLSFKLIASKGALLVPGRIYESILRPTHWMSLIVFGGFLVLFLVLFVLNEFIYTPSRRAVIGLFPFFLAAQLLSSYIATPSWLAWSLTFKRPKIPFWIITAIVAAFSSVAIFNCLVHPGKFDRFNPGSSIFVLLPILYFGLFSPYLYLTAFQRIHERYLTSMPAANGATS